MSWTSHTGHLTLGRLIDKLTKWEAEDRPLWGDLYVTEGAEGLMNRKKLDIWPGKEDSYRGFYEDLAFSATDRHIGTRELLEQCLRIRGRVYQGYKGGDYIMNDDTVLWIADYGRVDGYAIVDAVRVREPCDDGVWLVVYPTI